MNILVTGGTGFIGSHLVPQLISDGHQVAVITRNLDYAKTLPWGCKVHFVEFNIYKDDYQIFHNNNINEYELLIHLAWKDLPNYNKLFHIQENLFYDLKFLNFMISSGIKRFLIAGTCFEYGLKNGELTENIETNPITAYGIAKDTLRKTLQLLQRDKKFILQWVRFFYLHGKNKKTPGVLESLESAVRRGERNFDMSMGDQLRDFMSIDRAVEFVSHLVFNPEIDGVINCCSGSPISINDLIHNFMEKNHFKINLNRGAIPYNNFEPMNFWGKSKYIIK